MSEIWKVDSIASGSKDDLFEAIITAEDGTKLIAQVTEMETAEGIVNIYNLSNVVMCAYCGHQSPKSEMMAIVEHTMTCEKRPEKKLLEKAFEVEDKLYQRIIHLTAYGYNPETCEECKEISETLDLYQGNDGVVSDDLPFGGWAPNEADLSTTKIKQESFQDAVQNDPDMTAEQKEYWLSQPPNGVPFCDIHQIPEELTDYDDDSRYECPECKREDGEALGLR